ncbi:MAG: hypothetical protein IJ442_02505 [Bacteroidaceae bacterium]|nr:hypothetical protein [Bacteroidaceae bacterium]
MSNVPPTSPSLRSARWGLSYSRILRCSTRPSDDFLNVPPACPYLSKL